MCIEGEALDRGSPSSNRWAAGARAFQFIWNRGGFFQVNLDFLTDPFKNVQTIENSNFRFSNADSSV